MISKEEFIKRYKSRVIKKADISNEIAQQMAEEAFDEFGEEDTPEDCVDIELSYW